jgi:uncharacterized protein (DUF2235 family)
MKRIVIFCDGTWNSPSINQTTHVHRLSEAVAKDTNQLVKYFSGVGTGGQINTFLTNTLNKIGGGAFGWGLRRKILDAYEFVSKHYDPGDEILIFGFSRGAYTARSLAGMIRKCGLLSRVSDSSLRKAWRLYKSTGNQNHPDLPHIHARRKSLSPRFATSQKDLTERGNDGSSLVRISYLGIWDTVGALGIPVPLFGPIARAWNAKYEFHDTNLSSMIHSARHALALDERRKMFLPTVWRNLDKTATAPGLSNGDTTDARPFQQVWFVGDHGMVGGSGVTRGLTSITLAWLAEGATRAGLKMNPTKLLLDAAPDPLATGPEQHEHTLFDRLAPDLMGWRFGVKAPHTIHPSVQTRIDGTTSYNPPSLH